MTLPFRRRHHDAESGHDRARQLWSIAMIEPLDERDASWLDAHLDGCTECRRERDAQVADQGLLRSLRDRPLEPPRDLWARTAAAIERESARQSRGTRGLPVGSLVPARARLPLGVLSGVLVVLVVVAVSFAPTPVTPPTAVGSPSSGVLNATPVALSSPLSVAAAPLTYVQTAADGSIRIIHANVDEVCPTDKSGCAPLQQETQASLSLGTAPQALVASPHSDQVVVVSGRTGSQAGSVIVVPVPTPVASGAPGTPGATATPAVTAPASPTVPPASPAGSSGPTPLPTPVGAHSIAQGVLVVGEARYSDRGWLAFSAAPLDGSTGPDLYVWNGTDAAAVRVTTDHATYFSSWLGDRILASRFSFTTPSIVPSASASPGASGLGPIVIEAMPESFLFDPVTLQTQALARPGIWLPTVDPSGRFVTYWEGSLLVGPGVDGVQLGTGHLVLDGWLEPIDTTPVASGSPGAASGSPATSGKPGNGTPGGGTPGNGHPGASGAAETSAPPAGGPEGTPPPPVGPAGTTVELRAGPITAFEARFDPSGTRLAVWVADASDPTVGTLWLVVLDRARGRVDARPSPLPFVRALKGVSIDKGRLAWVTPPGQDGNQSTVQVLGWTNEDFGQVETVPGMQLTIVR